MPDPPCLQVAVDGKPIEELDHFWSRVVGAGRAAEGLRADWQRQLKRAKDACGFEYVRFHGIYHDDMHVYHETKDGVVYNFQYIDTLFDAILEMGVRPFVEFGFCPSLLATVTGTIFWWKANGSPPKSLEKWGDLVHATVLHWVERYGIEEVRKWYFECWNEANLIYFFEGTRSQYYALYEVTANVVKAIDKSFRVGGPATSSYVPDARFDGESENFEVQRATAETQDIDSLDYKPPWLEHFLNWCHSRGLPVDFVSSHPYPTDFALDTNGVQARRVRQVNATPDDLRTTREIVSKSPFPTAEIHLTEWSSSPSSRDHAHDHVPAAIYIVRTMLASFNRVNTIAYWTFTDIFEEEGGGLTPFHGGFGMINFQGFPKPTFHAFRLLRSLGNEVLLKDENLGIVTRSSRSGLISAIIFHYPPELLTSPPPAYENREIAEETLKVGQVGRKKMVLHKLKPGTPFKVQVLCPRRRGDVVWLWKSLGSPATINRQAQKLLDDFSSNLDTSLVFANGAGELVWEDDLQPWSVISFEEIRV